MPDPAARIPRSLAACSGFAVWIAAMLAAATGCDGHRSGGGGGVTGPPPVTTLKLQRVISGLNLPLLLLSPPADTSRLFVVQQSGAIRVIKSGSLLTPPFLDVSSLISTGFEQGLLGMAFDPNYASNGRFYISYTNTAGDSRIARYHVSGNPDLAAPAADEIILSVDQPEENHNGGMIAFGPDGMLWIALGDGGGGGDPYDNGQSRDDLLGSLLRIDVSAGSGYAIPSGNPYTMAPDRPELWNIGLRNPWRFSFDRSSGDLWIGDVGQSDREEIDVALAANGRSPGANYGWPIREGTICLPPATSCASAGFTVPVLEYDHGLGCSVAGGYVYRGTLLTGIQGTYFYGDYCGQWVRSFRLVGGAVTEEHEWPLLSPGSQVMSFGEDARGELYVLGRAGTVDRIVPGP